MLKNYILTAILLLISCYGCASLGKGFAEAIMDSRELPEECRVYSEGFPGLNSAYRDHRGSLKILNIHGIGPHSPGYARAIANDIADRLDLNIYSATYKEIQLSDPTLPDTNIGALRIYKYSNERSQDMYFYEYSWSVISEPIKKDLYFDQYDVGAARRTELNGLFKNFFNEITPDAVIYAGKTPHQEKIFLGVQQSFCWMFNHDWDGIPDRTDEVCTDAVYTEKDIFDHKYVLLSHSMGSQISLDVIHWFLERSLTDEEGHPVRDPAARRLDLQMFMLSNQIPLLTLGYPKPYVINDIGAYCTPGGKDYTNKVLNKLEIVAFTDPNDTLSYTLSHDFIAEHVDSRLCPEISNVIVNVAPVKDMIGIGPFANPVAAHKNYAQSDLVMDLMVTGTYNSLKVTPATKGCQWIEVK